MKTRDEVFKVRPEGRTSDSGKSKSQLRRMEVQKEGRRDITRPSPKPAAPDVCLYCGAEYNDYDGKITRCPQCATPF